MSRHLIVLHSAEDRQRAHKYVTTAPLGTRIEYKASKRSLPQNDLMWAMLTDVSVQARHNGRQYTPDAWKVLFMHAIGREMQFLPSLDGSTFIPWGQSSSDLSREEMTALIDFIGVWGAENGVTFHKASEAAA